MEAIIPRTLRRVCGRSYRSYRSVPVRPGRALRTPLCGRSTDSSNQESLDPHSVLSRRHRGAKRGSKRRRHAGPHITEAILERIIELTRSSRDKSSNMQHVRNDWQMFRYSCMHNFIHVSQKPHARHCVTDVVVSRGQPSRESE